MITEAKVNISAVNQFKQTAEMCKEYSKKFDRSVACVDKLFNVLAEHAKKNEDKIQCLQNAQSKLDIKIRSIEKIIASLTAQLNKLESNLEKMEDKLSRTDSEITISDENGEKTTVPNPKYKELKTRISALEDEIKSVREELYAHQCRLEKANEINSKVSRLIDVLNSILYSLSEKKNECKELREGFEAIKETNSRKGQYAVENLKKIQKIIDHYIRIKMIYDTGAGKTIPQMQNSSTGINININVNMNLSRNTVANNDVSQIKKISEISASDIEKHKILFDKENHICEYDGKSFGGTYNSYNDRIKGTSADNPILGYYEGARGESKYIPTNRSAEGIVVIDILKNYGLNGIDYRNGEPDFEVCAEAVVIIEGMTEKRYNYTYENGESCQGNFSQADIKLAESWNFEERNGRSDWSYRDVNNYRKANKLTWHEKCDTKTMVLVRSEINDYFKHIGGCSECRLRDSKISEDEFDE